VTLKLPAEVAALAALFDVTEIFAGAFGLLAAIAGLTPEAIATRTKTKSDPIRCFIMLPQSRS